MEVTESYSTALISDMLNKSSATPSYRVDSFSSFVYVILFQCLA